MVKVHIKADLERRLRELLTHMGHLTDVAVDWTAFTELVQVLDNAKANIGLRKIEYAGKGGLGYRDLLFHFRAALGADLAVPPNPSTGWIIKLVSRAREIGLDESGIRAIAAGARKRKRGPYGLEWLLYQGVELGQSGETGNDSSDGNQDGAPNITTGRL